MKIIHIFFLIFIIYYCNCDFDCSNNSYIKYHNIDTSSPDYEYDIEIDWTDDDEKSITVPFIDLVNKEEIFPIFVNGSSLQFYEKLENTSVNVDELNKQTKGRNGNLYDTISTANSINVVRNKLIMKIKSNNFKANENDVDKKYIKYFCWLECADAEKSRFRQSGIIVTVNNAKFLKLSKYLIGFLLLFL